MVFILNYRKGNPRLEEPLRELGHSVYTNEWNITRIRELGTDAVLFDFREVAKNLARFTMLSWKLKKAGIKRLTWCVDLPNFGSKPWKLHYVTWLGLVDIFASHSMQGLDINDSRFQYLPNAAWTSHYNLGETTLDMMRQDLFYDVDVSFVGNMDALRYREHGRRAIFLKELGKCLSSEGISYSFIDSASLNFDEQRAIIQKSRINLNYGCGADRGDLMSWGLPERCYGVPACGGFLLSEERCHAGDDFLPGSEIVLFRDLNDCLVKIRHFLSAPTERRTIAENACHRVINDHTYLNRAVHLLEIMVG